MGIAEEALVGQGGGVRSVGLLVVLDVVGRVEAREGGKVQRCRRRARRTWSRGFAATG